MADDAALFTLSFANLHRRSSLLMYITVTVVVFNIRIYSNAHRVYTCNFSICFDCSAFDFECSVTFCVTTHTKQ